MRRLAIVVALACALVPIGASAQSDVAAQVSTAVANALGTDTARVSLDPTGDLTVSFTIRNLDNDPQATRDGALSDTLAVLRAIYGSPGADVRTATVLGTFPFQGTKSPGVRPTPVLRAVLSADRARNVDWQSSAPAELPTLVDTWWLQSAFADVGSQTANPDSPMAVAIAHLDESLAALDTGEVRVGRSQFTQFFDAWDDVSDAVGQRFPAEYNSIDVDLERAEVALLHTQPEDVATARNALTELRATLAQVSADLE
ncbi:MAG: hypothetical protein JOZ81_34610 [Chloroflexi bacterium]|nr:hypothetical protein [Chloroflexota bacterium]